MSKPKDPPKTLVASVESMLQLPLRQHVLKRHPHMRFVTKVEHAADHRMHGGRLDHVHEDAPPGQQEQEQEEGEEEDNVTEDEGA